MTAVIPSQISPSNFSARNPLRSNPEAMNLLKIHTRYWRRRDNEGVTNEEKLICENGATQH